MLRTFIALTTLAVTLLAPAARARPNNAAPPAAAAPVTSLASTPTAFSSGRLAPVPPLQGISKVSKRRGKLPDAYPPREPAGNPTAWVTAKDLSSITLVPGGNGSSTESCLNKGTAGGTFSAAPLNQPAWYDDGFVGAGHPYFWFPGGTAIRHLSSSLPSTAYVTHDAYTIYIVMYPHVLARNETDPDNIESNPAAICFRGSAGLAVRAGDGGKAILWNAYWPTHPLVDFVEAPITSGDATLHVWKLEHGGGVLSLSVDGGIPFTVASGQTNGLTAEALIGFDGASFVPDGAFNGAICEWIIYDRTLSAPDDELNMAYLRNEWDTP